MKNFGMKNLLFSILIMLLSINISNATIIEGGINTNERVKSFCTVIDKTTKKPVPNARITIPSTGYSAYSDINGHFELKTQISGQTILSIHKNNYKPFSMTINRNATYKPFTVEIEGTNPFDISIETKLCHIGDNNFSNFSANAGQFQSSAIGPVLNKSFFISTNVKNKQQYLVIGSIIGIDTALARGLGQNNITTTFASPPSVYLNGVKIAEIKINGDNQKIRLPKELIKYNQNNTITIKAGKNLMQTAYIDYDDIEIANISIQSVPIQNNAYIGAKY